MIWTGLQRYLTNAEGTTPSCSSRDSSPRLAARRTAILIEQAELTLEEASGVIANGFLRLDPQEWIRAVEKRQAALGG